MNVIRYGSMLGLVALGALGLSACGKDEDVEQPVGSVFGTTAVVDNSSVQGNTPAGSNDVPMVPGDTSGMGTTP